MQSLFRAAAPLLPALFVAAALCACASDSGSSASRPSKPITSDKAYTGPAIAIDSVTGPRHLVILTAPSPGWAFTFDQLGPPGYELYLTIRRPDPGLLYPQVIVEQKLDSTVPIGNAMQVYARILDFGEKAAGQPYRLARETSR